MAASYPSAVKTFSAITNGVTKLVAALFTSPYDEITAIETELGTDVAGSAADLKTRLAVSINDDGTLNPQLGAWADKTADYGAQQAATDGFVVAYCSITDGAAGFITGYTDANSNPTTIRQYVYNPVDWNPSGDYSIMFPVKKGDYWKIVLSNATMTGAYWIPIFAA